LLPYSMLQGLAIIRNRCAVCIIATVVGFALFLGRPSLFAQSALDGFDPNVNGSVRAIALQGDGKIVIGGDFTVVGGTHCNLIGRRRSHLGRVTMYGTLDVFFKPGVSSNVLTIVLQGDGKILAGGSFTNVAGERRNYVARLNSDGNLDYNFNPGADNIVNSLAL